MEEGELALDHLFIFTGAGAPAADLLVEIGLVEGTPNTHSGQGTSNRRFFFHNAMLELLWVHDEREARSPEISPARLCERANYRSSGYSPFGLCFRPGDRAEPSRSILPSATWEFRPPYLPPGSHIEVATETTRSEPLIFATPFARRPDSHAPERRQPLEHPAGVREITSLKLILPAAENGSEALRRLTRSGIVEFETGDEHLVEIEFDRGARGLSAQFPPELPLRLRW